ncbi:hypothetical protein QNA08_04500 [Chelatococcus sp. SYSU_G07232]|uniref:Uncharacterized protein n=1 Tax=Chelatococcus albus TaxID=3047466 RepID=A0ABT7ADP4_9HYPH|nr:hypothetical protein [Chelatococcus sp. SYSU_G07232]MDJ1157498.1 hypothetical protein [Chelatococcus sp. SYSU_G07232]
MVDTVLEVRAARSDVSARDADHPYVWAVPLVYDVLRSAYYTWLPADTETAERLTRLHGAIVVMALLDVPVEDQRAVLDRFLDLCGRASIGTARLERLGQAVMDELTTVIAMRNRRSPRTRMQLAGEIGGRLGTPRPPRVALAA